MNDMLYAGVMPARKTPDPTRTLALQVRLSPEEALMLEELWRRHSDAPTKSEYLRHLLRAEYEKAAKKKPR